MESEEFVRGHSSEIYFARIYKTPPPGGRGVQWRHQDSTVMGWHKRKD